VRRQAQSTLTFNNINIEPPRKSRDLDLWAKEEVIAEHGIKVVTARRRLCVLLFCLVGVLVA
jgi:hypothetical protein